MTDMAEALIKLKALEVQLGKRVTDAQRCIDYYGGQQNLRFASDQFRFYFAKRYVDFSDNWTQVVADSPTERMEVQGIRLAAGLQDSEKPGEKDGDDDLYRVWTENGMEADSGLGFLHAITTKRSFGLVWGNDDDISTPEMTFEDSRECIVGYVPGSRRKRAAALKMWSDDHHDFATLYLPDDVWKFQRASSKRLVSMVAATSSVTGGDGGWVPREHTGDDVWPIPNPFGVVPMVELPNRPLLGQEPISDVMGVIAMQDAVNLLWAQLFTASDYAALGQRIIIGAEVPKMPILDSTGEVVGEKPVDLQVLREKRLLWVPDKDATVSEWKAADLKAYTDIIEVAVGHIAAQTRTPQHYLVGKMANLSADALKAAETGLVKKTQEKQLYFGEAIREMFRLASLAQGDKGKAKAVASGKVLWKDAEMRSEAQLSDSLVKLSTLGFPFEWIAERYGLSPTEVERVIAMKKEQQDSALFGDLMSQPAEPPPVAPAPMPQPPASMRMGL